MEEYDDLVPTPNEDGSLELTYRGWTLVDEVIWTMGRELVILDISYIYMICFLTPLQINPFNY